MKTKLTILMMLVMLVGVTSAWAKEVQAEYTVLSSDFSDDPNISGRLVCDNLHGTMVLKTNSAIDFKHVKLFSDVGGQNSATWVKIESSTDQIGWIPLVDKALNFQEVSDITLPIVAAVKSQYFRFTFSTQSRPIGMAAPILFEEKMVGDGTPENPYILDKAVYLQEYAAIVEAGDNKACAKIAADLDLTGMDIISINGILFEGVIDGDGHVIKNLSNANGLFKNISAATIKNLTIENASLTATDNSGAFATNATGTVFQNCVVKGTFSAQSTNAGGLVGTGILCKFIDCQVTGLNTIAGTNIGGLLANAYTVSFTNCSVSDFASAATGNVGGLVANAYGTTFKNCNVLDFASNGAEAAGGLVGKAENNNIVNFENCIVLSSVVSVGDTAIGGLAGKTGDKVSLSQCYSIGNYQVEGGTTAGALVGNVAGETTFNHCYAATGLSDDAGLHLPVYNGTGAILNNTFYYGAGSETAVAKADVGSGRLAYLLNGSVDHGTGPYYQKIGTEEYPVLTGENYVYRSLDGNSYTNTCPHHNIGLVAAYKNLSCIENGNAHYYRCLNPVCNKLCFENRATTTEKEAVLSCNPIIVENHSWKNYYKGLGYEAEITRNDDTYFNVTTLDTAEHVYMGGDYIVTYTNIHDEETMKFHEFFTVTPEWTVPQYMRYYVNGEERTSLSHLIEAEPNVIETHKEIVVDGLKQNDIIKIVYSFYDPNNATGKLQLYLAQEKPTGWTGAHSFHMVDAVYDCVEGGYDQHHECMVCDKAFSSDEDADTDNNLVPLSTFYHEPMATAHNFALSDHKTEEGLLKYMCQNGICQASDPDHFCIENCFGSENVPVTKLGDTYTADESSITMPDAVAYGSPISFEVENLTYSRTYYKNVWNPWFVPFAVPSSVLENNGILDVACIESIHNYDMDQDGIIDKTVLEVLLLKDGVLEAGLPYLVKPGDTYTSPLTIGDVTLEMVSATDKIHSETASSSYDFEGTYAGLDSSELAEGKYYSLDQYGVIVRRTANILPQRWYMKEVEKINPYKKLPVTEDLREFVIKVIGEEHGPTGVQTIYPVSEQREEVLIKGVFDLNGRALAEPQRGSVNIINGKKQLVR